MAEIPKSMLVRVEDVARFVGETDPRMADDIRRRFTHPDHVKRYAPLPDIPCPCVGDPPCDVCPYKERGGC